MIEPTSPEEPNNDSIHDNVCPLVSTSPKREKLLVSRSYSSRLNEPSTIAAFVSKPDSGVTKEDEKLLDA